MSLIDSNEVTNVEVGNEMDISPCEVTWTNNNSNPNISTVGKVDEETMVSSDLFACDPAKYSFCKEKCIINDLKVGESCSLKILSEIRNGVYIVTIWPDNPEFDHLRLRVANVPSSSISAGHYNRRANIGDFVLGESWDGDWNRGHIICVIPMLKLALIDSAELVDIRNFIKCNKPISDMYSYTGICELTDATDKFMKGQDFQFKITGQTDNEKPDEFEILIHNGDFGLRATLKPWTPMPEQLEFPYSDVKYGTTVCITGYRNHIHMYVRPLDTLGLARYNFIMETVAKCAETSPFLETLKLGESALALSADGNYYRAYVTKVEEDRAHVMYHDLGRREYVDRKKLKIFPDYLKKLGYCITKIRLQDVPKHVPPLMPIIKILDNLVENKVPLICTYDGIPSIEGVYLMYPNGESVNNMIRNCL